MVVSKNQEKKAATEEHKPSEPAKSVKSWNIGSVFWGLLLVVIGGLMLADNFDALTVNWGELWRLWPLAIIAAGISTLSLNNVVWKILSLVLALSTIAAVVWVMIGDFSFSQNALKTSEVTVNKSSNSITSAEVNVNGGATALTIDSLDQDSIVESKLTSNITTLSKVSTTNGNKQVIDLNMTPNGSHRWWTASADNSWIINLTRDLPIKLQVNTGASDNRIDLSEVKATSVIIKTGASSVDLKLGNKVSKIDIVIESGASSITVRVPKSSGVNLDMSNGLTSNDLEELDKVDYASAANKIDIESKIGVSSFAIKRY